MTMTTVTKALSSLTEQACQFSIDEPISVLIPSVDENVSPNTNETLKLLGRSPFGRQWRHADHIGAHVHSYPENKFLVVETIKRRNKALHDPERRRDVLAQPQEIQFHSHLGDIEVAAVHVHDFPVDDENAGVAVLFEGLIGKNDAGGHSG